MKIESITLEHKDEAAGASIQGVAIFEKDGERFELALTLDLLTAGSDRDKVTEAAFRYQHVFDQLLLNVTKELQK